MEYLLLSLVGVALAAFGLIALWVPNLTRFINFPGNERTKARSSGACGLAGCANTSVRIG